MKIHACSVAFRHTNITAAGLAEYALRGGFDGVEIWLPHARALASGWAALARRPRVPMLAAYLPLGEAGFAEADATEICALASHWGASRFRLFAGNTGSDTASEARREAILRDLRRSADIAADHGLRIAVEIHPGTLADTPEAALALLAEADRRTIGLNFDVLHVWESGAEPLAAHRLLAPHVLHYHLKTVTARERLGVFDPANVHDVQGHRHGICPLFDGVLDYDAIFAALPDGADGSLEWFGADPAAAMLADLGRIGRQRAIRAA